MTTTAPSSTFDFEHAQDGVVTVWLNSDGAVVVLNRDLVATLAATMDTIAALDPTGLIIASACDRAWIAGADLGEINTLGDDDLAQYLADGAAALGKIADVGCPTVAAIDGATLGGGLELALHCDGLVISTASRRKRPYPIGLPEASLGLCPGWGGTQTLPTRIQPADAILAAATGETFMSDALPEGLADITVETAEDVIDAARSWILSAPSPIEAPQCIGPDNASDIAQSLTEITEQLPDTDAARAVAEATRAGIEGGWGSGLAAEQRLLITLRHTNTAKERIEAFLARG